MRPKFIFPFIEASLYTIGAGCGAWFGFHRPSTSEYTTMLIAGIMAFSTPIVYNFTFWLIWKENVDTQIIRVKTNE